MFHSNEISFLLLLPPSFSVEIHLSKPLTFSLQTVPPLHLFCCKPSTSCLPPQADACCWNLCSCPGHFSILITSCLLPACLFPLLQFVTIYCQNHLLAHPFSPVTLQWNFVVTFCLFLSQAPAAFCSQPKALPPFLVLIEQVNGNVRKRGGGLLGVQWFSIRICLCKGEITEFWGLLWKAPSQAVATSPFCRSGVAQGYSAVLAVPSR